jgi:hypothetical protein
MVIASVSILAILVTEFTYIAQVSQAIAFGGLDQAKAHYLAKSGFKLSLLRLKAYQQVKSYVGQMGAAGAVVPKNLIEKVWSFPFFYPLPTNIPGMSSTEREMIDKFQKESGFEGKFSAVIEAETSKYNLNMILPNFGPSPAPVPSASPSPRGDGAGGGGGNPPPKQFDPLEARNSLGTYLTSIWQQKLEVDPDFASLYRDLRMDDLLDSIVSWADRTYDRRISTSLDKVPLKKAPYYSPRELLMIPLMDDELYKLFSPNLTASTTPGININSIQEPTLRALVPNMTKEEVAEFFKFRDSEEADNRFRNPDDFYKYIVKYINAYRNNQSAVDALKADHAKRNIVLVVDESMFKITVQAQVNSAVRTFEAWVTLGPNSPTPTRSGTPGAPDLPLGGTPYGAPPPPPDPGLRITFMRII